MEQKNRNYLSIGDGRLLNIMVKRQELMRILHPIRCAIRLLLICCEAERIFMQYRRCWDILI